MLNAQDAPVAELDYSIKLPNGLKRTGKTGNDGEFRLDSIPPGNCVVRLRQARSANSLQKVRDSERDETFPYALKVDGVIIDEGEGESGQVLTVNVQLSSTRASLEVGLNADRPEKKTELDLGLGKVSPVDELHGVQDRLRQLGFKVGEPDGDRGPRTEEVIKFFSKMRELDYEQGGSLDSVLEKLISEHGC